MILRQTARQDRLQDHAAPIYHVQPTGGTNLGICIMNFLRARLALPLLGTAVLCIFWNGLSTAVAEETARPVLNPRTEYATCDDIPVGVSAIKADVYIRGDIICSRVKASAGC